MIITREKGVGFLVSSQVLFLLFGTDESSFVLFYKTSRKILITFRRLWSFIPGLQCLLIFSAVCMSF